MNSRPLLVGEVDTAHSILCDGDVPVCMGQGAGGGSVRYALEELTTCHKHCRLTRMNTCIYTNTHTHIHTCGASLRKFSLFRAFCVSAVCVGHIRFMSDYIWSRIAGNEFFTCVYKLCGGRGGGGGTCVCRWVSKQSSAGSIEGVLAPCLCSI